MNKEAVCDMLNAIGEGMCPGRYVRAMSYIDVEYIGEITKSEMADILRPISKRYWQPIDKEYQEVSMDCWKEFLAFNTISERPYVPQEHDCDNFSIELAGQVSEWAKNAPFGLAFLNGHVINCFVSGGHLYFLEPQSDEIFPGLDDRYRLNFLIL